MIEHKKNFSLNGEELKKYQPNRYPFLMIDYVTDVLPGVYAKGYKNLTNNEWFFQAHYPGDPNMPATLQLEAYIQMLIIALRTLPEMDEQKKIVSVKESIRLLKEIRPGDRFEIETEIISWKRGVCKGRGIGRVNGIIVSKADITEIVPEIIPSYLPDAEVYMKCEEKK